MRRIRLLVVVAVVSIGAAVGAVLVDLAWNHRAASICNQEAEKPPGAEASSGHTIQWEWRRFAYVCPLSP